MKKIITIGNALTDELIKLSTDKILEDFALPKGSMQIIDTERYKDICWCLEGFEKQVIPGGSACNTARGIANLGGKVAFVGMVGNDEIGTFFENDLMASGVKTKLFYTDIPSGTALTFISPDTERTFATHLGAAVMMLPQMISGDLLHPYDLLHIEGYLLQNHDLIHKILKIAKAEKLTISLDLASYNVVLENLDFLKDILTNYVDIVFANEDEAKAFTGLQPREALCRLSEICKIAVVKIGEGGSLVKKQGGDIIHTGITSVKSVDTTGAGDFYAAGFLYGISKGLSIEKSANIGKILSGNIVSVIGVKIDDNRWKDIRQEVANL